MKKCIFLVFIACGLSHVFMGCAELAKKFSKKNDEHLTSVDKKIQEHDQALSNLNSSTQNLGKYIEELSQKTADIQANYSQLYATLNTLNSKFETKDGSLENMLSETQRNMDNLERKLTAIEMEKKINEIEKAKIDLQSQILFLLSQKADMKPHGEATKEGINAILEPAREVLEKDTDKEMPLESEEYEEIDDFDSNQNKASLQKLLDEALALYRDENYKEAISKWGEVLALDPGNLEAKFIIEIAKEKIKFQETSR